MRVPREVQEVFVNFHQDLADEHFASLEDMVGQALVAINERQRTVVAEFLDELLSGNRGTDEIQRIWWRTSADIFFPDGEHLIAFLRAVRKHIGQ
jgi:hypothetical protein